MENPALREIEKIQYHQFEYNDDDSGKYYCKSYEDGKVAGYVKLTNIIFVPNDSDPYKDHKSIGTLEVPNSRIKEIHSIRVGLSFLQPR